MKWTRRKFVATSAGATLVTQIKPAPGAPVGGDPATDRLRAVMDEIIPKEGDMPSASEAGGVDYFLGLQKGEPAVAAEVLAALGKVGSSRSLIEELKQFEKEDPKQFGVLRDFVYEAYYTQPKVWKLIGYEFYPTDRKGPHMKPFDETVIAKVRTKPKFYREA